MAANVTGLAPHDDERRNRVYTKAPAELVTGYLDNEEAHAAGLRRPLTFGIREVDDVVRTMFAGQLVVIVGRPSNGKSLGLKHLARRECQRVQAESPRLPDGAPSHYVAYTSLEEDEQDVYAEISGAPARAADLFGGSYDRPALRSHMERSIKDWPLWMQGTDPRDRHAAPPGMVPTFTVEQGYREIVQIERDHGILPSAWFVDYLQLWASDMRATGESEERIRIANTSMMLKRIAKTLGIPVVVAAQAKQAVDQRRVPIPAGGDIEGSNQPYKDADVVLTVTMPGQYSAETWEDGINIGGEKYTANDFGDSGMILTLAKQRKYRGFGRWVIRVDVERLALYGNERRYGTAPRFVDRAVPA